MFWCGGMVMAQWLRVLAVLPENLRFRISMSGNSQPPVSRDQTPSSGPTGPQSHGSTKPQSKGGPISRTRQWPTTGQVRNCKAAAHYKCTKASCTSTEALNDAKLWQTAAWTIKSYLRNTTDAKGCMGNCSVSSYCLLPALVTLFHGAVKIVPKDATMKNHPKSLRMLSVTNHQFNSYTIQWDYIHTDDSDHWLQNISAFINFWRTVLSFNLLLEESAANNLRYSSNKCHS